MTVEASERDLRTELELLGDIAAGPVAAFTRLRGMLSGRYFGDRCHSAIYAALEMLAGEGVVSVLSVQKLADAMGVDIAAEAMTTLNGESISWGKALGNLLRMSSGGVQLLANAKKVVAQFAIREATEATFRVNGADPVVGADELFARIGEAHAAFTAATAAPAPLWNPWRESMAPPFPFDVLPDFLREWTEDRHLIMGADRSALAYAALTACSGAIDHQIGLVLKDDPDEPFIVNPRLWTILDGDPSCMKTPIIRTCTRQLVKRDARVMAAWQDAMANWRIAAKLAGKNDAPPEPERPYTHVMSDTTVERLGSFCADHPRGVFMVTSEIAQLVGSFDRYSGSKAGGGDRGFWNCAYDGGPFTIGRQGSGDRAGKSDRFIANLSVAVLAGLQPDKLPELGNLDSDGFLQRFGVVMVRPAAMENDAHQPRTYSAGVWRKVTDDLAEMHPWAQPFRLSAGASEARRAMRGLRYAMQSATEPAPAFGGFCGKIENIWGAIVLILHLIDYARDRAGVYPACLTIPEDTALAATRIVQEFVIPHGLAFYESLADPSRAAAHSIAAWLVKRKILRVRPADFSAGPRATRDKTPQELARLLSPFIIGGWLTPEAKGPWTEAWHITPGLAEHFAAEAARHDKHVADIKARIRGETA